MEITISVDSNEPVRGTATSGGVSQVFVGWISLLGILAEVVDRAVGPEQHVFSDVDA